MKLTEKFMQYNMKIFQEAKEKNQGNKRIKHRLSNRKSQVTALKDKDDIYITDRAKTRKEWKNSIKVYLTRKYICHWNLLEEYKMEVGKKFP